MKSNSSKIDGTKNKAQATSTKLIETRPESKPSINKSKLPYLIFFLSFFLFFSFSAMAQKQFNYDTAWKKVTAAQEKGLPKTALEEVNKIYAAAKNGKDEGQQIKALIFQATLSQNVTENAQIRTIQSFEAEMKTAAEPVRSILASIAADAYWNYLQQNRYRFYRRTATTNFNKDSVDTWAITDFTKRISDLYAASIANKTVLQKMKLDAFEPIIIKGNARKLRPTLYDLLAHKTLDYYKTEEYDVIKPAYAFTLNDAAVLADANTFLQYKSTTKDSTNLQWKAVQLFQSLISFHENEADKSAFIDVDIERISWIHQKAVMPEKEQLYKKALENIYNKFPNNEEAMQAGYLLAVWWQDKSVNYKAGGMEEDRLGYVKAIEIAKTVVDKFPKNQWAVNCQNIISNITKKDIQITVEKVNEPNKPFRALVKYRNASEVNLAIVQITTSLKTSIDNGAYDDNIFWNSISAASKQKTWSQALPTTTDYREHTAEIAIDAVGIGEFYLLSSGDNKFSLEKNTLAAAMFYSSNISFVQNAKEVFVLDRSSGEPLANASLQVWAIRYDYNTRKNIKNKLEKLTTDKNGYAKLQQHATEDRQLQLEINWQNDHLFLGDNMNDYERDYTNYAKRDSKSAEDFEKFQQKFYFFTDRSIYRPGQLIYFKAIGVTKDYTTLKTKLVQSKNPFLVTLYNANNQKVDTLQLTVNEFGSLNGKFKLPENLLNGQFSLGIAGGTDVTRQYFSVEEYKRPKFLVDFDTVKGSYHVNDDVKIIGNAKAYAGNKVDGAAVKYRVKRTVRFLYPWMWWRRPMPTGGEMEITNGETITKADGTFEIVFKAIPDLSMAKETDPVFDYSVEADVTDINGETRSSTTLVPVGYKALDLKITIPQNGILPNDSLKNIFVSSKNLSGQFEPVKATIKIYQLNSPDRLLRKRYWEAPDTVAMDYKTFIQKFPNDPYRDEQDYHSWTKGKEVLTDEFVTDLNSKFIIHNSKFEQGWYIIEATATDKFGQPVKAVEWFQLYDMKSKDLPAKEYNWGGIKFQSLQPGETANFLAGTSANNLFVVQQTLKAPGGMSVKPVITTDFLSLNSEKNTASFTVTEADRGGYYVNRVFVKDNRIYTSEWYVNVPFTNKQLDVTFNTFRDKLQPGAEEKWNVTIKGSKGEKVAAEMLASMYDASLDQFKPHNWTVPYVWPNNYFGNNWNGNLNFSQQIGRIKYWYENVDYGENKIYDALLSLNVYNNQIYGSRSGAGMVLRGRVAGVMSENYEASASKSVFAPMAAPSMDDKVVIGYATKLKKDVNLFNKTTSDSIYMVLGKNENQPKPDFSNVTIRKNFNETAFFFPDLHTDAEGNINFSFTMPEALTKWKLQTLAHTKELAFGFAEKTTVTQKDLMIQPNAPRFLREGDRMEFSAKIVNLTDKEITGQSQLQLINTATNENVDGPFHNIIPNQYFTIPAGQSVAVKFPMEIPFNYNSAVSYRIVAKAGAISDGEEAAMPVLTNRMLVTETMPLNLRNTNVKDFKFEKLLNSKSSTSLTNEALTVEYASNPTWYAVQALPYLMEYPYECAEQTFNRFYANALASKIANSTPKIKAIFEQWKNVDTAALMSNLEKNQELKSALLEETPWVLAAQNESQQKKNIALLFDMVKLSNEADKTMAKLKAMQSSNGGFVWFKGGPDDRYITQYIITKIGHLRKLGAWPTKQTADLQAIVNKAIPYLDARIKDDYDYLVQHKVKLADNNLSSIAIQYLYMRSFFSENGISNASQTAVSYYKKQAQQFWLKNGKYEQGMIALALNRGEDAVTPKAIIKSLKENSISSEEFGMYWKELNEGGYYWWQAPIETQSLLIEAFAEIDKNQTTIDDLKTWLLKQKQTQNWRTTKATSDACYALLLQGSDWLNVERNATIKLGNKIISADKTEAGTGYFKQRIDGKDVTPEMGNINVSIVGAGLAPAQSKQSTTSWGAIYWQYFEDLDKITSAKTPLSLIKKLFVEKNTDKGPVLTPINDGDEIKVGDKVKVRIELRVDRNMEYIHMKDMRAACMEPTNVISQYKYQDGLGYYESTKDASTNFFFSYLNKGVYVFEYPLNVTLSGNFSNGITTIQCMYAPEFTSHSEGVRVNVK